MGKKRIKRWKSGMDAVKAAQYLHDMAAEGWILEEVGYLFYVFRENAPADLKYAVQTFKEQPSKEELETYTAKGWQVIDHWEQEYVFARERDTWTEDAVDRQTVAEEIGQRIEKERENARTGGFVFLAIMGIVLLLFFMQFGIQMFSNDLGWWLFFQIVPNFLIIFLGGWLAVRRLRKKRERVLDGESLDKDIDWRRQRKINAIRWLVVILLLGGVIYYEMGWNETIYDLPQEISYAELPAVRLEKLEGNELIRMGKSVAEQQEDVKDRYGFSTRWHTYDNAVRDYGNLIMMRKIETNQNMRKADEDAELELKTKYYNFVFEAFAQKQYNGVLEQEEEMFLKFRDPEMRKQIEGVEGEFDELHICQQKYEKENVTHILCRQGRQLMELDYNGQAEIDRILAEVEKVFEAQN